VVGEVGEEEGSEGMRGVEVIGRSNERATLVVENEKGKTEKERGRTFHGLGNGILIV